MLVVLTFALFTSSSFEPMDVTIKGQRRTALVYGSADNSRPAPLVFAFHGHGGDMFYAARRFRLREAWPEAIVVYPQGLPTVSFYDPKGNEPGWDGDPTDSNKDILMFDALLKKVEAKYNVDKSKVFVMGHSNGALFAYTLWGTRASKIAAFAVFEGRKLEGVTLKSPKPFFLTIGDADLLIPAKMQRESMQAALEVDGAEGGKPAAENETLYSGKQPVMLWSYRGGHEFQPAAIQPMVDFWKSATK